MVLGDSTPIAGRTGPTVWGGIASRDIHLGTVIKKGVIDFHVALGRRYKANRAVAMLMVVPVHQLCYPRPHWTCAICTTLRLIASEATLAIA